MRSLILLASLLMLIFSPLNSAFSQEQQDSSAYATLIILPFRNLSLESEAKKQIMPLVYAEFQRAGFDPESELMVQQSLRNHRLRDTGQITDVAATQISREMGTHWIIIGSIDQYNNSENIEAGISLRLLNSLTDDIVWAQASYATRADYTKILGLNKISSAEQLAQLEIVSLTKSLREWWIKNPDVINNPDSVDSSRPAVILIPFDNNTSIPAAAQWVNNILLSLLVQRGYKVIEPGIVNDRLVSRQLLPRGSIDLTTLAYLSGELKADYCITGLLSQFQNETHPELGVNPVIELEVRMLETTAGKLIWSKHIGRSGADFIKILQLGQVHSVGVLLSISLTELLDTLPLSTDPKKLNID